MTSQNCEYDVERTRTGIRLTIDAEPFSLRETLTDEQAAKLYEELGEVLAGGEGR